MIVNVNYYLEIMTMKKVKVVIGTLFILGFIGIVFISAYRSSESYRKKHAGNVEPSDVVDMSNSGDVVDTDEVQFVLMILRLVDII